MHVCLVDSSTSISPQDRGLIYGDGFFTTGLIVDHKIAFWSDHRSRLENSSERLSFSSFCIDKLESHLNQLPESGIIRICITRGTGPRGYAIPSTEQCHCFIETFAAPELALDKPRGLKISFCETPISINPLLAGIKHINRLDHVLARSEIEKRGFDEGIMLSDGHLICATQANLFVCRDNIVLTPRLDRAGVDGVMKKQLRHWCDELGIKFREVLLCAQDLEKCDEVFLSNSVFGIMSVDQLDSKVLSRHTVANALYQKFIQSIF